MSKINILVVASDNMGGVGFYRSSQPHKKLEEMYPDDFNVTYNMQPDFTNLEDFRMYDIIHIHKGLFEDDAAFLMAMKFFKENNIVTVMDLDDHWRLGPHHPQYYSVKMTHVDDLVKRNFGLFDYITTTTPIFANEIKPFNKNVEIFPNAIDPTDERFVIHREPSEKLRIGFIMGSTHEYDLGITDDFVKKLPKEILDKIEIVLCGFDLRGNKLVYGQNGEILERRPISPKETVWFRYEQVLTDNYKNVSPQYAQFLNMFIPNTEYPSHLQEGYRRCWTKDMDHYYQHYSNVDVLLAPLETVEFNKVKSQLKVIECAFSHTAIIASDFGPYTIDLKNLFEKGGGINQNGNAILIEEKRNHKDWAKAIEKLVKHPELVTMLQDNLYRDIHEEYDLRHQTDRRAEFYKKIVSEKK